MAKAFLEERNISYTEKDVAGDEPALKEMVEKSGQFGVPVIDVDGKIVVGFDRGMLEQLIGGST
jgi:glutaredoxin